MVNHLFTSESVAEGHPDKVADQVSDAILDAALAGDPASRVACETMVTKELAVISGEITTTSSIDYERITRDVIRDIGYTSTADGFDCENAEVRIAVGQQSPDIARGVDGKGVSAGEQGAGDQGLMFGLACRETEVLMPMPIMLAHRLIERLARLRHDKVLPYLRPDGKSQVTIEYDGLTPVRCARIVVAAQHDESVTQEKLQQDLVEEVVRPCMPHGFLDDKTQVLINATGRFVTGGPDGDCGLTGRKIIVDTYGGYCRHGGGAFSGKDPSKVDRSATYATRYIAKNLVVAGVADLIEVQVAYCIGVAEPMGISCNTFGTGKLDDQRIVGLIRDHFDLRPAEIIEMLDLRRPIYRKTASCGHFGREEPDFTWERTDRADEIRRAAGL